LLAACEPAQVRDIHLRAWDDSAQDDLVRGVQHFKTLQRLRLSFRTFVSLLLEINLDNLRVLVMQAPNFNLQTLDVSPWPKLPSLETFELEETMQRGLVVSRTSNFFYQTALTVLQAAGTRLRQVSLVRSKEMFDKDKSSLVTSFEPAVLDCLARQELQSLTLPFLVVTRLPYPSLRADVLQFGSDSYPSEIRHGATPAHVGLLSNVAVRELIFERHGAIFDWREIRLPASLRKLVVRSTCRYIALWSGMFAECAGLREVDFTATKVECSTLAFLRDTRVEVVRFGVQCRGLDFACFRPGQRDLAQYLAILSLRHLVIRADCSCCPLSDIMDHKDGEPVSARPRVLLPASPIEVLELEWGRYSQFRADCQTSEWLDLLDRNKPSGLRQVVCKHQKIRMFNF
jgi:hypothetical protein